MTVQGRLPAQFLIFLEKNWANVTTDDSQNNEPKEYITQKQIEEVAKSNTVRIPILLAINGIPWELIEHSTINQQRVMLEIIRENNKDVSDQHIYDNIGSFDKAFWEPLAKILK